MLTYEIKGVEQYFSPKLHCDTPYSRPATTRATKPTTNPVSKPKPTSMPLSQLHRPNAILDEEKLSRYFGRLLLAQRGVPQYLGIGKNRGISIMSQGDPTNAFLIIPSSPDGKKQTAATYIYFEIDPKTNRITEISFFHSYATIQNVLNELRMVAPDLANTVDQLIKSAGRTNSQEIGNITVPKHINIIFKEDKNMMSRVIAFEKGIEKKSKEQLKRMLPKTLSKPPYTTYSGNPNKVLTVAMAQFGVVSRRSNKNVINTFGLAECIGLAIIDKKNGVAALAHITAITKTNGLSSMLERARNEGGRNFEAIIVQGQSDATTFLQVVKFLNTNGIRISYVDRSSNGNLGISTDGRIFNNNFMGNPPISNSEMTFGGLSPEIAERKTR